MALDLGAAAPLLLDIQSADREYVCLLSILVAIGGGGGSGTGAGGLLIRDEPTFPTEPPPDDTSIVTMLSFRSGHPGYVWDPDTQQWLGAVDYTNARFTEEGEVRTTEEGEIRTIE